MFLSLYAEYPMTLCGMRFSASYLDFANKTVICYTDLTPDKICQINYEFERFLLCFSKIMEQIFVQLDLSELEIKDGWENILNRREMKKITEAFGQWKMSVCPFGFLDDKGNLSEEKMRVEYLQWFLKEYEDILHRLKDWFLEHIEVDTLEHFCTHLNRFTKFPSAYFRKSCVVHGWRMKGLAFGEMCTDGTKVLSMDNNGNCVLA